MLPRYHIFFSAIVSAILFLFNTKPFFILLFFLSSILIDIDHYFLYVAIKKHVEFNLIKVYRWNKYRWNKFKLGKRLRKLRKIKKQAKKQAKKQILCIFHTAEFFLILLILSLFFRFFWPIFFGCLFHETVDLIWQYKNRKTKIYIKAYSLIWYIVKKKRTGK